MLFSLTPPTANIYWAQSYQRLEGVICDDWVEKVVVVLRRSSVYLELVWYGNMVACSLPGLRRCCFPKLDIYVPMDHSSKEAMQ